MSYCAVRTLEIYHSHYPSSLISATQVYIGVKSITFQFHRKPLYLYILDAALLVVAVACMNVQLWLSTDLANKLTREAGQ